MVQPAYSLAPTARKTTMASPSFCASPCPAQARLSREIFRRSSLLIWPVLSSAKTSFTVRAETIAITYSMQLSWFPRQSIFAYLGETGNLAMARPSDVMTALIFPLTVFFSSNAPRFHSSFSALCSAFASGEVGKGKFTTSSIFMSFICRTKSSTGRREISGAENSSNSFVNTADEYKR